MPKPAFFKTFQIPTIMEFWINPYKTVKKRTPINKKFRYEIAYSNDIRIHKHSIKIEKPSNASISRKN